VLHLLHHLCNHVVCNFFSPKMVQVSFSLDQDQTAAAGGDCLMLSHGATSLSLEAFGAQSTNLVLNASG
jgi:hypothetical protein